MPIPTTLGPWPKYPAVYEINTRIWLSELSVKAKRPLQLDEIPESELERYAEMGFNAIWLMGVWTTGEEAIAIARTHPDLQPGYEKALPNFTPKDVIGSPYAITTYQVSEHLGGPKALARLRERMTRHGLRLILDFVCNHTSRDHRFVHENPDVFIHGSAEDLVREPQNYFKTTEGHIIAHGRDPFFAGWSDTAQINYAQPAGREAMAEKLRAIAAQCDGVRCDMAMLILPDIMQRVWGERLGKNPVLLSFWKEIIDEFSRAYPNFLFLAETYWDLEWKLQQEGFHFTYDKTLYDRLCKNDFAGVKSHLQADINFQNRCARFIENHDEPRAAEEFGPARARSAAIATFFTPGLRLLHEGQLEGHHIRIPVQLGRRPFESEDIETAVFYEKLLSVLRYPIFQNGIFSQLTVHSSGWGDSSNNCLLALSWTPPADKPSRSMGYLVVVNLSGGRAYGRIPLPAQSFVSGKPYLFYDHFDGKRYEREGGECAWPGLYVALEAFQPHLFEVSQK
jgi:glycosidase